jgi:hypothetical protein
VSQPWFAFCTALSYGGTLWFGALVELLRGATPGRWLLAAFLLLACLTPLLAWVMWRFVPAHGQRAAFDTVSWVAFITALPVIGFAGFSLFALTQERGGWHPAPDEALLLPLSWLGAVLLPLCGWRLRSAAHVLPASSQPRVVTVPARSIAWSGAIIGVAGGAVLLVWLAMPKSPDQGLSGKVVDGTTGNPLSKATVTLARVDENKVQRQTRTDSRGGYKLHWPQDSDLLYWRDGVRHGVDLVFSASAPGYETGYVFLSQIGPSNNNRRTVDFALHPAPLISFLPGEKNIELMADEVRRRLQEQGFGFDGMVTSSSDQPSQLLLRIEGLRVAQPKNGNNVWEPATGYLIAEPQPNGGWNVQGRQQLEGVVFTVEPDSVTWLQGASPDALPGRDPAAVTEITNPRPSSSSKLKTASAASVPILPTNAVELVAISYHPSVDQPWWRPDGSPLETGFTSQGRSTHPDAQGYELVFRHGGLSDDVGFKLESLPPRASISGMEPPLRDGRLVENHRLYVIHVPTNADVGIPRTITLRMGMATGAWTTVARRSATVGQSGAYALEDGADCRLLFGDPVETAGETRVTVSHNTLENWETRVCVVDLDGQEHRSARHYNAVGELASTAGHFKGLRLDRVKELRFEVRPYRWFEFRDVALKPAVDGVGGETAHDEPTPTSRTKPALSD